MSELRFDGRVAIVTGAGNGLGRAHALLLASRGARVVVNDLGGSHTGGGSGSEAADQVVATIKEAGGEAVPNYDSVTDGDKIVQTAMDTWGQVDIIVNNAGILRDVSYAKMTQDDWDLVYQVHVLGPHKVTHAAWPHMRAAGYGRIVNTASAAGIYGNFGQVNYAMAKLGTVGFTNSLAIEGGRKNIHANVIAPIAGSRMTETILPKDVCDALQPELVSPLVAWLAHESCEENGALFEVGGGFYGKLRWERAGGKMYRLGRNVTPENIKSSWGVITDFDSEPEHPTTVMESMAPIMANVNAGESKGGNEFIDADEALAFDYPPVTNKYDARDVALYALGIGAAVDPLDETELAYVYEMHGDGFKPFPTYSVIPALKLVMDFARDGVAPEGMNYGLDRILHGEQYTEVYLPLEPEATLEHRAKITDVWDKGKHALIVTEVNSFDEDGDQVAKNRITTLVRGAGGWGGDRGPTEETNVPPERAPDAVVEQKIDENQALLYRLSGDWNPLHADPGMAQAFGFEKPILHGLCTYGFAARHVVNTFADGDPRTFKSIQVRFADSVFPGETLVTEMWKESDTRIVFQCKVKERESDVVTRAAIEFYDEIPKKAPKAKPATEGAAAAVSSEPISADVFEGIKGHFAASADAVKRIGKVFQFQLTNPTSKWTLDCGNAAVGAGETAKPDCTLQLTDADFMDMCTGKADPMKLFSSGALKISGDLMASQKLDFLQKMDPQLVMNAAKARAGAGGGGGAAAPAAEGNVVEDIFLGIQSYVQGNNALTSIGKTYLFVLTDPDSTWTIDLKDGKVFAGGASADCTLALTQENFLKMTSGEADPMKLFSSGALKISGDLMASQKLDFLQKIDPKEAAEAVAKARAEGRSLLDGAAPTAGGESSADVFASKVFEGLAARLAANTGLAGEVGAVLQFNVSSPDSSWIVDLTGSGDVKQGTADSPATTITLDDSALAQLAGDSPDVKDLYMRGTIRVDGDLTNSHKLAFLKGLA